MAGSKEVPSHPPDPELVPRLPDGFASLWLQFEGVQPREPHRRVDYTGPVTRMQALLAHYGHLTTRQIVDGGIQMPRKFIKAGPFPFQGGDSEWEAEVTQVQIWRESLVKSATNGIFIVRRPNGQEISCYEHARGGRSGIVLNRPSEITALGPTRVELLSGMLDMMREAVDATGARNESPLPIEGYPHVLPAREKKRITQINVSPTGEPYL